MSEVQVKLSSFELLHAAVAGVSRRVRAIHDGRPGMVAESDLGWERDVVGAIGEYAVARALDRCWSPSVGFVDTADGDLPGVQVRTTSRSTGSLILRENDPPEFPYVLVLVDRLPVVRIAGWALGADGKIPAYWRERNPAAGIHRAAYFVPQSSLADLSTLGQPRIAA